MGIVITKEEFEAIKLSKNGTIQELIYTTNEISGGQRHVTILCTEKMVVVAGKTVTQNGTEYERV